MTTDFDLHTLSIAVDATLEEYLAGTAGGLLGMHAAEIAAGDRSKLLRFRHEHAHFTSLMASGLADLYGVFSDYMLAATYAVLRTYGNTLRVPIVGDGAHLPANARDVIASAFKQINELQAMLFGFAPRTTGGAAIDPARQHAFWKSYELPSARPIIDRFYELLRRITPPEPTGSAVPRVSIGDTQLYLSARSVMEAYAISIELMNTHLRKMETELTVYSESLERSSSPLYTVAIGYLLEHGLCGCGTLEQFLRGEISPEVYYTVAAAAFAAMQVPVIQKLDGEVIVEGTLKTLSPAHRFESIVQAMGRQQVPVVAREIRSKSDDAGLFRWLQDAHTAIGDDVTLRWYLAVHQIVAGDERLARKPAGQRSLIEMSWAARANFMASPNDYVLDGGMYSEMFPCQTRYVRTSDGKLVHAFEPAKFQRQYVIDHAALVLQAAVCGKQWDAVWCKLPEIDAKNRADTIAAAFLYARMLFERDADAEPNFNIDVCLH